MKSEYCNIYCFSNYVDIVYKSIYFLKRWTLNVTCQLILKGKQLCSSEKEASYLYIFSCDYIETTDTMFYNNFSAFLCCIPNQDVESWTWLNEYLREFKLINPKSL